MEGIERLETEALEMNNSNVYAIFEYLKTRTELYEKFNNKEKSIKQMYEYIYNKSEKFRIDNVAMVKDNMVYLWAVTYFSKSNEELGLNKKTTPTPITKSLEKKEEKKSDEKKPEDNQMTLFEEVQK